MSNIDFEELREKLTPDDILRILARYDVSPVRETSSSFVFPTCCHNLDGGSNKLYYYFDSKIFKCYTECDSAFDIFELLMKMEKMRGNEINLFQAIRLCGIDTEGLRKLGEENSTTEADINYLYNLLKQKYTDIPLPLLDEIVLERFLSDDPALDLWRDEGIDDKTLQKYGIMYDPIENCIIIPNRDTEGNLISIRGRFLNEDAPAKYRPIIWNGKVLSHPSSATLYGIFHNKNTIKKARRAIIFESEKSVMKMDTYYGPQNNCSVATLGKTISQQQIRQLLKLGIREVVLAYDADYYDYATLRAKREEYKRIAASLKNFFTVCVLIDFDGLLDYKDSPIDKGKEIFERIYSNRIYL